MTRRVTGTRVFRQTVLLVWFVVLWVALWGQITWANVIGGLVIAAVLLFGIALPEERDARIGGGAFRPLRALWFLVYFAWQVVKSNLQIARQVIDPRNTVHPGILRLPLHGCSDALVTLIANAITLTPGSITVEVRRFATDGAEAEAAVDHDAVLGAVVYVHVLNADDPEAARAGLFELARVAVRAFGSERAMTALAATEEAMQAGASGLTAPGGGS